MTNSVSVIALAALTMGVAASAQTSPGAAPVVAPTPAMPLPLPDSDPLRVDMSRDPILQLGRTQSPRGPFRDAIATAVASHPQTIESLASGDEAREVVAEARERTLPSVDLSVNSYRVIAREFSNDPENIVERSRPSQRTDAIAAVNYTLFDFGAGESRIAAAGARLRAAGAETEQGADRIALSAIAAWYDVFAYRALVSISVAFVEDQQALRRDVEDRVRLGASAEGDLAQVDSFIAGANTRLAEFRRILANAESRYTELIGSPPPANIRRAPIPLEALGSREAATLAAMTSPAARAAQAIADATRDDARAARSDNLPQIGVGVDAGRYGVFENERDFDIRGRITVRQRFFGGGLPPYSYVLTTNDANVASGAVLTVNGARLLSDETLTFDGSNETNGAFRVFGGAAGDTLTGGAGSDLLFGGLGADTMVGGAGNDMFRYQSVAESTSAGRDGIQDFATGDLLDLSRIDAIAGTPENDAFSFIGSAAFTRTAGQLRAEQTNGIWTVQGDIDGDGVSDIEFVVVVTDNHPLTTSDFIL